MEPIIETHKRKLKERLDEIVAGAERLGLTVAIERAADGKPQAVVTAREAAIQEPVRA